MRLGIIGRGPWGDVYADTLRCMGVEFWQETRNWTELHADGVIVASAAESHTTIARYLIRNCIPALIEKPLCLDVQDARILLKMATDMPAIVFTGHTRLYSPAWRVFKAQALERGVRSVRAVAGGPCKLDPLWDWGPHLVAMCLDLGFDPLQASIETGTDEIPLTFIVNRDMTYFDSHAENPRPLEVLLTEFMAAIEKGEPDIRWLELGVKVVEALEVMQERTACP